MPLTILIVEKNGDIKEQKVNNINETELYKKVGLKTSNGFTKQTEWNINKLKGKSYNIRLYGKIEGRANYENKYEFPPPVDERLFFGNCVLINKNKNDEYTNLTKTEWNTVYDHLYGEFDDLDEDDEDDDDDEDENIPRTKSGYVKDGFIVDDDEDEDEDEDYDDGEDYDDKKNNKKTRPVRKSTRNTKNENTIFNTFISNNENSNYLECTGELSEEEYL